jgi:DNA-binding XRE family transcriptional regulator
VRQRIPKQRSDAATATHANALADYRSGRDPGLTAKEMRELLAAPTPLAFWRRKRGLTQASLAEAAGIKQNYLSDLETGKREGSPAQWLRIARSLNLPLEDLISA